MVFDNALELTRSVDELKSSIYNISWHATLQISTNRWKFGVEAGGEAVPSSRAYQEMTLVTNILDSRANIEVIRDEGAVWRLLWLAACCGSVLANVVQL